MRIADNVSAIKRALDKITGDAPSGVCFDDAGPGQHPTMRTDNGSHVDFWEIYERNLRMLGLVVHTNYQHDFDHVTGTCIKCGATLESVEEGLAPSCDPVIGHLRAAAKRMGR